MTASPSCLWPRRLVTTAGKVGSETVRLLRERDVPVRVLVRDPAKAAALAEAGAEIAKGDLDVPAAIDDAMTGVSAVVLVSPAVPAQELNVVASAARAGAGHVVKATSKASADCPSHGGAGRPRSRRAWLPPESRTRCCGRRLHAERPGAGPGDRENEQFRFRSRQGPIRPGRRPRRRGGGRRDRRLSRRACRPDLLAHRPG